MKANHRIRLVPALGICLALGLTASCSERRVEPSPAPSPSPTATPTPPPPPAPRVDWRQAPLTPGDWQWGMQAGRSTASFASGALTFTCNRSAGTVTIRRAGSGSGSVPVTIETSNATRSLVGAASTGSPAAVEVNLPARDPLLDAMAFSRGRFAFEVMGLPTLYVPSWPEISRVIEDCR